MRSHRRPPGALRRPVEIAERCRFSLDELRYEYPDETIEGFANAQEALAHLAEVLDGELE